MIKQTHPIHNIRAKSNEILVILKDIIVTEMTEQGNFLRHGKIPKFSDIEVIALSLTVECLGVDSENYLFSKLHKEYGDYFTNLISRDIIYASTTEIFAKAASAKAKTYQNEMSLYL